MRRMLVVALLLVISLSGCVSVPTSFIVEIDSIATPDSGKKTYVILPAKKDMVGGELVFQEYARYLKQVLSAHGYREASDPEQAEIAVMLAYGIAAGSMGSGTRLHRDAEGNVTGASTKNITGYARLIIIRAYDYKKYKESKTEVQLWQTTIESNGSSGDLRRVFPVLIAASQPYIGTNTGKKVMVTLSEDDSRVIAIKAANISQ